MLSIGAMGNGQGSYYIGLASDDYYFSGGEPEGIWLGKGASALGLNGIVENEQFLRVFHGFDPCSDLALIQNAGNVNRQPGWDLTFSAPKSVSTLWAVLDQGSRKAIQDSQFAAVKEALQYLEDEVAHTRRGKGGLVREAASLIIATFEHGTSRAEDPQIHTHSTVLNIGVRADGTTGTILSKPIYQQKMTIGALYRAHLAHRLELLGFQVERRGSVFEVVGVPEAVTVEFSKRRMEIEAILASRGEFSAKASAIATFDSRQLKSHIDRKQLFERWTEIAATFGFTQQDAKSLRVFYNTRDVDLETKSVISQAVEHLSSKVSHFAAKDLLRAAALAAPGTGLSATNLRDAVKSEISSGSLISLGQYKGIARFTTPEILESEKRLLAAVENMNRHTGFRVPKDVLERSIQKAQDEETAKARKQDPLAEPRVLNSEQLAALAHITDGGSRISVVSGMAGTGKTFLLSAARTAWEQQGYRVLGATVAGKAARGLGEGASMESVTISKLLLELDKGFDYEPDMKRKILAEVKHATWQVGADTRKKMLVEYHQPTSELNHEWKYATWQISKGQRDFLNYRLEREKYRLDNKTVLVVDEAAMVGTGQMEALVKACNEAGAQLVLTGDARQIQPVDIGGPFNSIAKRIGETALKQIVRQELDKADTNPYWRREAVHAFADGRAQDALSEYAQRGFLNVSLNRHGAMKALINKWQAASKDNPKENMIFVGTRRETEELNGLAQAERRKAGKLGFRSIRIGKQTIYERDRVIITQNKDTLGISNGDLATVTRIDLVSGRMIVKLDSGRDVTIPFRTWQEISLGYAVTSHKGQGVTVRNSFILCGGSMTDREITYVQASRARVDTHFFTEEVRVGHDRKKDAAELTIEELSRQMSRSRKKDLAHDVLNAKSEQIPTLELLPEM